MRFAEQPQADQHQVEKTTECNDDKCEPWFRPMKKSRISNARKRLAKQIKNTKKPALIH